MIFRPGKARVMIATDIISRGIDVIVSLVINYDMPKHKQTYIHRKEEINFERVLLLTLLIRL